MCSSTARIGIGIALLIGLAGTAMLISNDHPGDTDAALAQACAGLPTNHQLESALFNARAQSTGGFDAICAAAGQPPAPGMQAGLSQNENADGADGLDPKREHRRRL